MSFATPTPSDNCPGATTACSPPSGTAFPKGTTTVTCTATDASGNTASCSFTVTVNDNQPPSITCPANITTNTDPGQCSAVVSYANATATDNCPGVGTPVCTPASGSTFPTGTTTVNCTVSDAAGNPASCSFTVTVNDNENPMITCPANITTNTDPGQCSAVVSYANATAADNCPGVGTPVCTPASGSTFPKGTTTVNCTVSDAAGNPANCSFTVTVNDNQPPSITCPANITTNTDPGQCSAVVNYANATATDNCPGVGTPVCTPASGSTFPKGTTTVNCTVSDAAGNPASCSFTVTVNDNENPMITCPANIVMLSTTSPVPVSLGTPTTSDNCAVTSVTNDAPASFAFGTTSVTWTAMDAAGNSASCTQLVNVIPAAKLRILSALHTVGLGSNPGSTKEPQALNIKVFDKANASPDPKAFIGTWNSGTGLLIQVLGPTVVRHGNGDVNQYEVLVPSSSSGLVMGGYLIIGKATVGSVSVYVGTPDGPLATGASNGQKYLQVIKNGQGQILPARTTGIPGSLLLVVEPEYLEFTSNTFLMPIVYESVDGEWGVSVQASPPNGFVSYPSQLSTEVVTGDLQALQFTVTDVGSKWSATTINHSVLHNGAEIKVTSKSGMLNKQRERKKVASREIFGVEQSFSPTEYGLLQNFPDPFNPTTTIQFDLPEAATVSLKIYNIYGQLVETLAEDAEFEAGRYSLPFDASELSSGVYLYRLRANDYVQMKKMLLVK